jgi:hypothetical protein
MRKSNGRKKGPQLKAKKSVFLSTETPATAPKTIYERIRDHPLNWLLGLIAALLAILATVFDILREPDIRPSTAQIDDPFYVHFSLQNTGYIFDMVDMKLKCKLIRIKYRNIDGGIFNSAVNDGTIITIPPKKFAEYGCPLNKMIRISNQITQATIAINAEYKTLGIKRVTDSEVFNWDVASKQWTIGTIIN